MNAWAGTYTCDFIKPERHATRTPSPTAQPTCFGVQHCCVKSALRYMSSGRRPMRLHENSKKACVVI